MLVVTNDPTVKRTCVMKSNKKFLEYLNDNSAQGIGGVIVGITVFVVIMAMGLVIIQGIMNSTNITSGPMAEAFADIGPQTSTIFGLAWNVPLVLIAATVLGYLGYRLYSG